MEKRLVKVKPYILDLCDPEQDLQESLFSLDENSLLKLDRNEATVVPSPLVIKTISKSLDSLSLNRQPDIRTRKLRRKLSYYSGVSFDNIACFASLTIATDTLARTYLQPGLEALIMSPSENCFANSVVSTGARLVFTRHADIFAPTIEEMVDGINSKTRLIYIANLNSISGALLTEAEIVFLLSYAENAIIVVDESCFEFCGATVTDLLTKYSNLVVLRTFSKAFALAGLDVSYILTDSRNLRFINRLGLDKGPNTLAQIAAESAIDDINYTANFVRSVNESKKMLFENLLCLGYDFRITAANFFLLKVKDPDTLVEALTENNIYVNNLSGVVGFEDYVRITIGTPSQTGVLLDVLAKLSGAQTSGKDISKTSRMTSSELGRVFEPQEEIPVE